MPELGTSGSVGAPGGNPIRLLSTGSQCDLGAPTGRCKVGVSRGPTETNGAY